MPINYFVLSFNKIEMAGTPQDSGISLQTVTELGPSIPLFGVCMGLQCIGEAFGGLYVHKFFT
jgi:anthranilate/para-aminobenzoate synthase component II